MIDLIIIGAGPAGISASLYVKRSNYNVLVLYNGESSLEKAEKIDNYYGFENGISGSDLYNTGIKQAENIGVKVKKEEVLHIEQSSNGFEVTTTENKYESKALIIATGNKKIRPNIKGIQEFEGKGVSYCAICDGFFYRNKNVVVIGNGKFAINEANILKNIAQNVTILTNGLQVTENNNFNTNTIPLWKNQVVLALGINNAKQALQSQQAVTNLTNDMLKKNSEILKQGSIEIAQESERAIVDIETLQKTNRDIIETLDKVIEIHENGRTKRMEAEKELENIEKELKDKMLEIKVENN